MPGCTRLQTSLFRNLLLASLLITASACQRTAEDKLAPFISTAIVKRGSLADVIYMAGTVSALNAHEIESPVSGVSVKEILTPSGTAVEEGQPLLQLDTTLLERTLREAEADLVVAQTRLNEAMRTESDVQLASAQALVDQNQAAFDEAEMNLAVAKKQGLALWQRELDQARADLQLARDKLQQAGWASNATIRDLTYKQQFHAREVRDLKTDAERERARAQQDLADTITQLEQAKADQELGLRTAQEVVHDAEAEVARLEARQARARAGQEDPQLTARLAYEQARSALDRAQQQLKRLQSGEESDALQAARTLQAAAQAKVEQAQADIAAATVSAPFKGLVLAMYANPGQRIKPGDKLAFVADLTSLQVRAQVTEMEIPRITVSQAVRISFDAMPGRFFPGEILTLPPRGESRGGLGYYEVVTSLVQEEPLIRLGMLANVRIIVGEKTNALVIPAAAVQYRISGEPYVNVQANGQRQDKAVELGINDGIMVEVLSGLDEGETVVISLVPQTQPQGPRVLF